MKQCNWRTCLVLFMTIALVASLGLPFGNSARAEEPDLPSIDQAWVDGDELRFDIRGRFSEADLSLLLNQLNRFIVSVDGESVEVTEITGGIYGSDHIPRVMLTLAQPVKRKQTVTIQYFYDIDIASENLLSGEEVEAYNETVGGFKQQPKFELPRKAGYKPKSGDKLVTFIPTSRADFIEFELPVGPEADASSIARGADHDATDYVIINNSDHISYTPSELNIDPEFPSIVLTMPQGQNLEEGVSYTLAMSDTASGNEIELPKNSASTYRAMLTLYEGSPEWDGMTDTYTFDNLTFAPDEPEAVDKTRLADVIHEAQLRYGDAVEGNADGQYPQGAKDGLQAAIDAATAVKGNPEATQTEVNRAIEALNQAMQDFKTSRNMLGTISISGLSSTGVTLGWQKATDDVSTLANGEYVVYRSSRNNIDTPANAEENGTEIGRLPAGTTTMKVTGLVPKTTYYFNVVFKDKVGNRSAYAMKQVTTTVAPQPPTYPTVPVTGVSLEQSSLKLTKGTGTTKLSATVYPDNATNKSLVWSSSDPKVVKVDENGVVTPIAAGTATITVTTVDQARMATIEVKVIELIGLKPSEKTILVKPNESYPFELYALYSDGTRENITEEKDVKYRTSAKRRAVADAGVIHAGKTEGKATITITYRNKKVKLPVNVSKVSVTKLELQPTTSRPEVDHSESLRLSAELSNKATKDVAELATWSSSDPAVAEVDENGKLAAIAPGTAVITAIYGGKKSEVSIEVSEPGQVKRLTASKRTVTLSAGKEQKIEVTAYYRDNAKKNVTALATWSSADETIATVKNGVISGKAKGTVKIQATYGGKTTAITVQVTK